MGIAKTDNDHLSTPEERTLLDDVYDLSGVRNAGCYLQPFYGR
jgi:hypothetical protein